jgi:hypothetical protein
LLLRRRRSSSYIGRFAAKRARAKLARFYGLAPGATSWSASVGAKASPLA